MLWHWGIPWSSSRVYIFPSNTSYVWSKCTEVIQVWSGIYPNAGVFIASWNACIVWSIDYCNQVPDEIYQEPMTLKAFGYYRIVHGIVVFFIFGISALFK